MVIGFSFSFVFPLYLWQTNVGNGQGLSESNAVHHRVLSNVVVVLIIKSMLQVASNDCNASLYKNSVNRD